MSTEYTILNKDKYLVELNERSCFVSFSISELGVDSNEEVAAIYSAEMTADELRTAIIKQIEVLSYISDDANEVLKRFNVEYGQAK